MTTARHILRLLLPALVGGVGVAWTSPVRADDVLDGSPVVRRNMQYRAGRHELTGVFGASMADPYVRTILPGVRYDMHLRDWVAVGGEILIGLGTPSSAYETIERKVTVVNPNFVMEATNIRLLAAGHASLAPLVGKFVAFGSLPINFDAHINLSLGLASVAGTPNIPAKQSVAPGIGGGIRVFLTTVLALTFDIDEVFVERSLAVNRDGKAPGVQFEGNTLFRAGLSFFVPPTLERAD